MSLQLQKKKMGIIAAINKQHSLSVLGNPAMLKNSVTKKLRRIIIYGASGGVGDRTYNVFNASTVAAELTRLSSNYPNIGRMYLQLEPNTSYTFWSNQPRHDSSGNNQISLAVNNGKSSSVVSDTDGVWLGQLRTVITDSNGYLTVFSFKRGSENWELTEAVNEFRFMAVKGNYTTETMPSYEAYGYKIPILLGNKTTNLYVPTSLVNNKWLIVNPEAKTAIMTNGTNVANLQDWNQDFMLNKGSNTVSIETTIQPSDVEWRYLSSKENK